MHHACVDGDQTHPHATGADISKHEASWSVTFCNLLGKKFEDHPSPISRLNGCAPSSQQARCLSDMVQVRVLDDMVCWHAYHSALLCQCRAESSACQHWRIKSSKLAGRHVSASQCLPSPAAPQLRPAILIEGHLRLKLPKWRPHEEWRLATCQQPKQHRLCSELLQPCLHGRSHGFHSLKGDCIDRPSVQSAAYDHYTCFCIRGNLMSQQRRKQGLM